MKRTKERKVLEAIELVVILLLTSLVGLGAYEVIQIFTEKQKNMWPVIFIALGAGVLLLIEILIGVAKEKIKEFEYIYGDKAFAKMRRTFQEEKERFMYQFKETMHDGKQSVKSDVKSGEPEIIIDKVEKDDFAGDPVYDNLDNLFGYTKRVVNGEEPTATRNYIDAEFTVVGSTVSAIEEDLASFTVAELKSMCKEKGITGYSAMRKAELIEVLENYNRAQK